MVIWHLTMRLFPAKCPERATMRKLWRQTGNSSLLPAKCWPLLHVIRACSWRWPDFVTGIPARFSKFAFVLFCYITNHFVSGNIEILGEQNSLFPSGPVTKCLLFLKEHPCAQVDPLAIRRRKRHQSSSLHETWPSTAIYIISISGRSRCIGNYFN